MKRLTRREDGFSMMEVLIALAVLSIGLTGVAVMQLSTLKYVHSSHYRSMASTIALDFEERVWWELADNTMTGCPDLTGADGSALDNLLTHWNREYVGGEGDGAWGWSDARMLKVPGLQITAGTATTNEFISEVPITLTWAESRFDEEFPEGETSATESFTYNVRVVCRKAEEEEEV
ncbi:MAG TPA: type IV pilus modification protein PilV [Xanthomonadales bacterium]|nr:type IV pilus modification protein PilV [Xanthomonadales bacterium]